MLCDEEKLGNWQMRFAVIYRSERKKIIHSQLHMISWLEEVLRLVNESPSPEEFPHYFRFISFKKTEFEENILSDMELGEK